MTSRHYIITYGKYVINNIITFIVINLLWTNFTFPHQSFMLMLNAT